tara:strand:- start:339 stop:545 length:207 start_codon:yes stop_codon:yes gene_type:complete
MNKWIVVLFDTPEKENIYKIFELKSVKHISYLLDIDTQIISNFYHNLINPRGILKYCIILQKGNNLNN